MSDSTTFKYGAHIDEKRRLDQHEQVKEEIRDDVQRKVKARAVAGTSRDRTLEGLAEDLEKRAVSEVSASERDLQRARAMARVSQVVDYVFYVLYGLIGLMIVLELLGAREGSGFKQFLNAVTTPFLAPFRGLMVDPAVGSIQLMLSYVVALVVYGLLHLAINGALRLVGSRKTVV